MIVDQIAAAPSNFVLIGFNAGLLFMQVLLFCTSLFLMLLILVQRGKGGGLTGALGGMGGQSAFGSKAGDAFTKITVITAMIWITLCMVTIAAYNPPPRTAKNQVEEPANPTDETLGSDPNAVSEPADSTSGLIGDDSESGPAENPDSMETESGFKLDLEGPEGSQSDPPVNDKDGETAEDASAGDSSSAGTDADGK